MTGSAPLDNAVFLPRGEVVTVHVDGHDATVWSGTDGDVDRLAVRAGRVVTWPTAGAAADDAFQACCGGWTADDPAIGRSTLDFRPAQAWLRGQRTTLDPRSALDLWNFAGDVAASTGAPWRDRGRLTDRCYRKLVAANAPYVFDLSRFQPRWSAGELRCIRAVLNSAVHLLRAALP